MQENGTDCVQTLIGKMTSFFRDQVSCVSEWFILWNECEQVVTLYSLLRKITLTQAKFLAQVLEHILQNRSECDSQENFANDPACISGLCNESKDFAVSQLLKCLPLLKVGNTKAKAEYLNIMPLIMAHSVENGCHIEECRQLLSYSLIHPAISRDELAVLTFWMNSLEEYSNSTNHNAKPQSILSPPFGDGGNDGLANPTAIPILDKNNALVPNGVAQRFLANPLVDQSYAVNNWPMMLPGGNGKGDQGALSNEQMHAGVIGTRNRSLTASSSLPLTDNLGLRFAGWDTCAPAHPPQGSSQLSYPALQNVQGQACIRKSEGHQKLTRTASLVPQPNASAPSVSDWLSHIHGEHSEHGPSSNTSSRLNSLFVNAEPLHAPLSPQSSITSSGSGGSDVHQDDLHRAHGGGAREDLAMKDVSVWLKSLRLHKYSHLFQQITYNEMMNLTEEWLEARGVTKGARNKIIVSIRKLKERQESLRAMEKEIMGNGNLKQAITDLRQMLNAPTKHYSPDSTSSSLSVAGIDGAVLNSANFAADGGGGSQAATSLSDRMSPINESDSIADGDIPGQMTRVLGKICTQLLVKIRPDCDCLINYQQLLERCINHHAFTDEQKKKMISWRQQIHRVWQFLLQKQNLDHHRGSINTGSQSHILLRGPSSRPVRRPAGPSWTFGAAGPCSRPHVAAQHQLGHPALAPQASAPHCPNPSTYTSGYPSRLPHEVSPVKQPLGRTQSAPIKTVPLPVAVVSSPVVEAPENGSTNEDIHASLDSLCISMMEHALGN